MKFRSFAAGFTAILTLAATMTAGSAVPLLPPNHSFNDAVAFGAEPVAVRRTVAARGPRGGVAVRTTAHRPGVRPVHPIARPAFAPA
jgi:hypothetical protein